MNFVGDLYCATLPPIWRAFRRLDETAWEQWRRRSAFFTAALVHVGLLWFFIATAPNWVSQIGASFLEELAERSDAISVALLGSPKPIPPVQNDMRVRSNTERMLFQPLPQIARIAEPRLALDLPPPIISRSSMVLPLAHPADGNSDQAALAVQIAAALANAKVDSKSPSYGAYFQAVRRHIDGRKVDMALDSKEAPNKGADIALILDKDGQLLRAGIVTPSGEVAFDTDALKQLEAMSPFPQPPSSLHMPIAVVVRWLPPRQVPAGGQFKDLGSRPTICIPRYGQSDC